MDVGYLGPSLTWNPPPPASWSSGIPGMLVLASPGWAGMADERLSCHGGSCPVKLPSLSLLAPGVSVLSGMPGHAIPSLAAGDELFCCACATHCQSHPALSWLPSSVPTDTSTALREAPARTHGVGHTPAHTHTGYGAVGQLQDMGQAGTRPNVPRHRRGLLQDRLGTPWVACEPAPATGSIWSPDGPGRRRSLPWVGG